MARIGPAALDLSPIVATFVLLIVGGIVVDLIGGEPAPRSRGAVRRRRPDGAGSTR